MDYSLVKELCGVAVGIFVSRFMDSVSRRLKKVDTRSIELEKKVDLILDHPGIDKAPTPVLGSAGPAIEVSKDIRLLLQRGQKIQAIKVYRDQHPGTGLKEAKDVIDKL